MARKIYYTSKGQPYIKLANGRPKFISKRSAGMSDVAGTGDVADLGRARKKRNTKKRSTAKTVKIRLSDLGKLVKAAGACATIITSKGIQSFCPSQAGRAKRKTRSRK